MEILFIGSAEKTLQKAGCLNDYLRDVAFFGLREVIGEGVRCSSLLAPLYKPLRNTIPTAHLWGRGFTTCWLLDTLDTPEQDVQRKLQDRRYDYVIYGNIWMCDDYYEQVAETYPPQRVAMLDGIDQPDLHPTHVRHPYFKRELRSQTAPANVHPISFAIPTPKISSSGEIRKKRMLATCIPGIRQTYIFEHEQDYYDDYRDSLFAVTMAKHGWDCIRHYEIIANRCIPIFLDIGNCPKLTMAAFPKDLCGKALQLISRFNQQSYASLLNDFTTHLLQYNTSKALGNSILNVLRLNDSAP